MNEQEIDELINKLSNFLPSLIGLEDTVKELIEKSNLNKDQILLVVVLSVLVSSELDLSSLDDIILRLR